MPWLKNRCGWIGMLLLLLVPHAHGLEIRNYAAARHDRFIGYPSSPAWNTNAWFDSPSYTGVGWIPPGSETKQFTLVSPKHVVCATHYAPATGTTIRFLGSGGAPVDRTVALVQAIPDTNGDATDLTLCTLDAAITALEGVTPLPYLSLMEGEGYSRKFLTVFGWHAKAGSSSITAVGDYTNPGNNAETRIFEFQYQVSSGSQDDCYLIGGDSGSPSFAMVNGQPALVGLHFLAGYENGINYSYDTLVPHYISELNALMAVDGYAMIPLFTTVRLGLSVTISPAIMRQANPGTCQFTLVNHAAATASNVVLNLEFPAGSAPVSLTAPGWTVTNSSPTWQLTRISLAGNTSVDITATWTSLPVMTTIPVKSTYVADGAALAAYTFQIPISPSYAAWAIGLQDASQSGDPDQDGISNLLEYAFGSDPGSGLLTPAGYPGMLVATGFATLSYPVRADATARGLVYQVEYSQTLDAWTTVAPPGVTTLDSAYVPVWDGFLKRSITFPSSGDQQFARVRVLLNE